MITTVETRQYAKSAKISGTLYFSSLGVNPVQRLNERPEVS